MQTVHSVELYVTPQTGVLAWVWRDMVVPVIETKRCPYVRTVRLQRSGLTVVVRIYRADLPNETVIQIARGALSIS